jgi:hypothetical protein
MIVAVLNGRGWGTTITGGYYHDSDGSTWRDVMMMMVLWRGQEYYHMLYRRGRY